MKALVIGANGFAGKYLMRNLEDNGFEVYGADVVSDNDKVRVVDMLSPADSEKLISDINPDYIFNLAGQAAPSISWEKILLTMHLNIDISVNIAEACRKHCPKCRILLIGSANQYDGFKAPGGVIDENCPLSDNSPYDVSKNTQEALMKLIIDKYDLDIIITRSFNHIGPGQRTGFVITDYCKRVADLERGVIDTFTFGNLDSWRDFSDARDIVNAYRLIALKGARGEIYNVGSGKSFYIRDLVGTIVEASEAAKSKVTLPPRLPDDELIHIRADISKLQAATGFEPQYDVFDTVKAVLDYYRNL